jgi:hypothetical protein
MIFSPSTRGFYDPSNRANYDAAGVWPTDGVEVSDSDWRVWINQPPAGQTLGVVNGLPAWVAAPVPTPSTVITSTEFLNRFTQPELGALMGSPQTVLLLITCAAAGRVDLSDPAVKAGVIGLVQASILTTDRAMEVLAL